MIDFVVVSSDLRPYVLDTRVKTGAELSTDHHLVFKAVDARSLVPVVAATPEPGAGHRKKGMIAVKLKESYRAMLACGTPNAFDGYQVEVNTLRISSIPPTCLPLRKQRLGTLRWIRPSPKDEIRPEYLKSLDVVGLSRLTRLCNIAWRSGTVPLEWQTGVVVPLFKKWGLESVFQLHRGITLLSLPWEGLRQGTGEENLADSRTSDSEGTMRFSSRSWNTTLNPRFPPSPMVMNFG
ncbi:hypothetical protein L3Q82_021184 [Scortum barcoo]|uniref:Uncharacterized protein n=1 Tax=Scortum barcoo TaxID=214431 RepID=A0ACB8X3K1_9TELE|nr:hypothetical protein L3Q82_021184 [Scortum barcoo]